VYEWVEIDYTHESFPSLEVINEVYSAVPAGWPPRQYVLWVMYEVAGQNIKDTSWTMDKMQTLVKKHPDLENDFRQILDGDDVRRALKGSVLPAS
jgi:hypothetical protein